jgi:hypothetical protein
MLSGKCLQATQQRRSEQQIYAGFEKLEEK